MYDKRRLVDPAKDSGRKRLLSPAGSRGVTSADHGSQHAQGKAIDLGQYIVDRDGSGGGAPAPIIPAAASFKCERHNVESFFDRSQVSDIERDALRNGSKTSLYSG